MATDTVIRIGNSVPIPEDVFREFIIPCMDEQTLMRTARTCKDLYASITGNDREWADRSEKMGSRARSLEEYKQIPLFVYNSNRRLFFMTAAAALLMVSLMPNKVMTGVCSGICFIPQFWRLRVILRTDVIPSIRLLTSRIPTCTKNYSSSLLNRVKILFLRGHRPESRSL